MSIPGQGRIVTKEYPCKYCGMLLARLKPRPEPCCVDCKEKRKLEYSKNRYRMRKLQRLKAEADSFPFSEKRVIING